jgi:hypothetical protein
MVVQSNLCIPYMVFCMKEAAGRRGLFGPVVDPVEEVALVPAVDLKLILESGRMTGDPADSVRRLGA